MAHPGSCHCGRISYEVDGEIEGVIECNCSICRRHGYLLWFVPRANLRLSTPESDLATYRFNTGHIAHHFCANCGCATFGMANAPDGTPMAAINLRCLDALDLASIQVTQVDGRSR